MQKMSFIIPHKDDPLLDRLLNSLSKQTCKDFEVIIIDSSDDGSCLKTVKKWSKSLNPKVISAECGRGTARNIGAKLAKTDILVFVDADVVLPKNFAEGLIKLFTKNSGLVAVGFPIYPTKINKISHTFYRFLRFLDGFSYRYGKPRIPTTCAAYSRSVFQSRFFLDIIGEDVLFSADIIKYGEALFAKHMKVFEEPRRWDKSSKVLKNLWHYIPAFIANFLIIFGLHNVMMPTQEIKRT
jgi:glycosyltransferase involved in cell wall biosynthesis